jgi:uncharacterized repeat protein (TIGR04138 family)
MASQTDLDALARLASGYAPEAFAFIGESLRHAARIFGKEGVERDSRHLAAAELVEGVLDLATQRFGLMAELVLREWGLRTSEDIGRVTFALIEHGIFSKQPSDRIEDFAVGPAFGAALTRRSYERLCPTLA